MINLPTHEDCAAKAAKNEGSQLEQFIYENEPAGVDESAAFRDMLCSVLNEHADRIGYQAWEGGRLAFAKEIGNDMTEDEEDGPIEESVKEVLDRLSYTNEF